MGCAVSLPEHLLPEASIVYQMFSNMTNTCFSLCVAISLCGRDEKRAYVLSCFNLGTNVNNYLLDLKFICFLDLQ